MAVAKTAELENLSFETALKELEEIVRELEAGEVDLDASISRYERGVILRDHCQKKLSDAKLKVEKIVQKNGATATEPFDAE